MNLILKEGIVLALIGLGFGLVGAFLVNRGMHRTLYGVGKIDLSVLAIVATVLVCAALLRALFQRGELYPFNPWRLCVRSSQHRS